MDYLAGDSDKVGFGKQTIKLIEEIEELDPAVKEKLLFLAKAIIRMPKQGKHIRIKKTKPSSLVLLGFSYLLIIINDLFWDHRNF